MSTMGGEAPREYLAVRRWAWFARSEFTGCSRCPIDKAVVGCWSVEMSPTVLDVFETSASKIHTSSGSISATDLALDGRRLAGEWSASGVAPGDRVAIYADNSLAYLRCITAAAAGRFVLVSVNRRYSPGEARRLVERSGATSVVTDAEPEIFDTGVTVVPTTSILRSESDPIETSAESDDPFIVFTTSGTTSEPKMVLHDQRSVAHHAPEAARQITYTVEDRVLVALPLCGVFGFNGFVTAVASGASIWVADRFEAVSIADLVANLGITSMLGTDDMYHRMLDTEADLSSLRVCGYGRFNPSLDDVVGRAEARGATLTGVYGMSEVQALFTVRDSAEPTAGRERAGGTVSSETAAFRILDPDTLDVLPDGESGELLLSGPSLFAGYLAEGGESIDEVRTGEAHHEAEGRRWFRTGDLAKAEPDGSVTFITRIGDVLRLGGFLVSPSEIESVVLELDGINEAVAVAVARPGGVRAAVVVIADHDPDVEAVIAHCNERLARFKVPVGVVRVDEFPTTPSANGTKIRVTELRDLVNSTLG